MIWASDKLLSSVYPKAFQFGHECRGLPTQFVPLPTYLLNIQAKASVLARGVAGLMNHSLENTTRSVVRPRLGYCIQFWGPQHKEVCGATGVDPEEGHKNDQRTVASLL